MKLGLFIVYQEEVINSTDYRQPDPLNTLRGSLQKSELLEHSVNLPDVACLQGEQVCWGGVSKGDHFVFRGSVSALFPFLGLQRGNGLQFWRHYRPHLHFTKPQKLGHQGARPLEKWLSGSVLFKQRFHPSSRIPHILLSSFFLILPLPFYLPPPPCARGAVERRMGWRGDEGREARHCNRVLLSSLCRAANQEGDGRTDAAEQAHQRCTTQIL